MMPQLSRFFAAALFGFACLLSGRALAQTATNAPQSGAVNDDHLIESGNYINSVGNSVHRPAHTESGHPPAGATAQCRDGSFSFSQSHRGTCSHHGGVTKWL
jgi:hypothetical protein